MKGHYSPKKTKKPRLPLYRLYYAVVLLLVAVSGTSMWTTTTLAKYVTSSSGSDSARVARFAVSAAPSEGQPAKIELDASGEKTGSYTFTVSNKTDKGVNETATGYDVVVTFPKKLTGVTLTLKNGETPIESTTTDSTTYTFDNAGNFPAGTEQIHHLTLTFAIQDGAEGGGEWEKIKIEVRAAQKD